jgi:hypothetical protein
MGQDQSISWAEGDRDDALDQPPGIADGADERERRRETGSPGDDEPTTDDLRDEEEPEDMPGGAAAYAGKGDTGTDEEAPGGMEGYASDEAADHASRVPVRHSAKTSRETRED